MDGLVKVELFIVHQCAQSLTFKDSLDERENSLDGIEIRRVADVQNGEHIVLSVDLLSLFALMAVKLVHK